MCLKMCILIVLVVRGFACRIVPVKKPAYSAPVTPPARTTTKPTRPPPVSLYAGIDITYDCSTNDPNSQLRWIQHFSINDETINYPVLNGTTKYSLRLSTMEEFDNGSTLICFATKYTVQTKNITLIPTNSNRTSTTSDIPIIAYNEESEVEYNCTNYTNYNYPAPNYYIILINGNKGVKRLRRGKKPKFSQSDNSSILACMFFTEGKQFIITRYVQGKSMLVYNKPKPDVEDPVTAYEYYYYIGGALFVALILTLIIVWSIKNSRSRRPRPLTEAKEDRNANTDQVTYAELYLKPTSKEFRSPIGNESPYAEIADLDQERYVNLSKDCRRSTIEESPYMEMANIERISETHRE